MTTAMDYFNGQVTVGRQLDGRCDRAVRLKLTDGRAAPGVICGNRAMGKTTLLDHIAATGAESGEWKVYRWAPDLDRIKADARAGALSVASGVDGALVQADALEALISWRRGKPGSSGVGTLWLLDDFDELCRDALVTARVERIALDGMNAGVAVWVVTPHLRLELFDHCRDLRDVIGRQGIAFNGPDVFDARSRCRELRDLPPGPGMAAAFEGWSVGHEPLHAWPIETPKP